jgi:hypothetical protein
MQDMATETVRDLQPVKGIYPFTTMGAEIAAALVQSSENLVAEAVSLQERAKVVSEGIIAQIQEQVKMNEDMNERLRAFGESILNAHNEFMNGK